MWIFPWDFTDIALTIVLSNDTRVYASIESTITFKLYEKILLNKRLCYFVYLYRLECFVKSYKGVERWGSSWKEDGEL